MLKVYMQEGYVIGCHKSYLKHEIFFENGIINLNDYYYNNNYDLSNTVMPSGKAYQLCSSFADIGSDMESAIILKIPFNRFIGQANLFELNEKNQCVIPKQFIVGALEKNGKIYENENYMADYDGATILNSEELSDENAKKYNPTLAERQEECEIFLQAKQELEHPIKSIFQKIKSVFKRGKNTVPLLEETNNKSNNSGGVDSHEENGGTSICERVQEPDIGDRTVYLESDKSKNSKEGKMQDGYKEKGDNGRE